MAVREHPDGLFAEGKRSGASAGSWTGDFDIGINMSGRPVRKPQWGSCAPTAPRHLPVGRGKHWSTRSRLGIKPQGTPINSDEIQTFAESTPAGPRSTAASRLKPVVATYHGIPGPIQTAVHSFVYSLDKAAQTQRQCRARIASWTKALRFVYTRRPSTGTFCSPRPPQIGKSPGPAHGPAVQSDSGASKDPVEASASPARPRRAP
ncbi:hypothetical protein PCL_06007 [Purpureocillium lilacinum]|uniref:Uncharacterized protein n=2 Tax=Purpureocillium lilacinum TaxID=33203 RepID=A0A2U3ELG4_PURLI|nr:hypothetical protein PCL_06007 [Purpureocillium lilacinum]